MPLPLVCLPAVQTCPTVGLRRKKTWRNDCRMAHARSLAICKPWRMIFFFPLKRSLLWSYFPCSFGIACFSLQGIPCLFRVFPFVSKDVGGWCGEANPFFGGVVCGKIGMAGRGVPARGAPHKMPPVVKCFRHKKTSTKINFQPAPKYHTKGCSRSSADSPGVRTLVFVASEPFHRCEFRASVARTPFCAILWRSPKLFSGKNKQHKHKHFGPNFLQTFPTRTPGCPGVKKFLPITGPQENPLLGAGVHDSWRGRPRPEGFSKNFVQKKFALIFRPLFFSVTQRGAQQRGA